MTHMKCPNHKNNDLVPGKSTCQKCVDNRKAREQRNIATGKCRKHSDRDSISGRTLCQECIDRRKYTTDSNMQSGKCRNHKNVEAISGKTLCQECLEYSYWNKIYKKYNLTKEQYFKECEKRNYLCDLCKIECLPANSGHKQGKVFAIDHDHKTDKLRGLLCNLCNNSLSEGLVDDRPRLLNYMSNLVKYLDGIRNV